VGLKKRRLLGTGERRKGTAIGNRAQEGKRGFEFAIDDGISRQKIKISGGSRYITKKEGPKTRY